MEQYFSPNDTGVEAYKIGDDFITVKFKTGKHLFYRYTYAIAGEDIVENLKMLARSRLGGLNSALHPSKGIKYTERW